VAHPDEAVTRLLTELAAGRGEVPTTVLGRARRAGAAALRMGGAAVLGRLRGGDIDTKTLEKLALSLGELKGIAMKVGQILSYLDTPCPRKRDACCRSCK